MNNTVAFKVAGTELSAYIENIQKKSDVLTNSAIKGAIDQVAKGKEVLKVIDEQIKATEKRNGIESQAIRSIALDKRNSDIQLNKEKFDKERENVYGSKGLSDTDIKEKINAVNGREKESEEKIKNDYRETLTITKEQERQSKLQTSLSRENLDALKQTAKDNVKAITNGDIKLADVIKSAATDEEKLVAKLTEEGVNTEKKNREKEGGGKPGIFASMLAVDNLNKLLSSAGQLTSTQNGFDMIKPAASMAGQLIGGAIGGAIGLLFGGIGAVAGAAGGAAIGGTLGQSTGELLQRTAVAKQDFLRSAGRFKATTGMEVDDFENTENIGVNNTDFLKLQTDFAKRIGSAKNSEKTTKDALYLDKGYGVEQGTSANIVEMQRSAREGNKDLAALIGGILQKGDGTVFKNGDHTFLNEFLGKFTTLQKDLLKTQTNVASGTTMDILTRFSKLGGEWDAKDTRSQGNISSIQGSLVNPGSDNLKALSFGVLRNMMPNSGIFDILKEREKGLGSPAYLKGMLGAVDSLGGDENSKQLNLSGMFPGLSKSAVARLYENRKGLMSGDMSIEELKSQYKGDFQSQAESNTPDIDRDKAKIDNGLLKDMFSTIEDMGDAISNAITNSLSGAVIEMKDGNKIHFVKGAERVVQNATKKAKQVVEQTEYIKSTAGFNPESFMMNGGKF